MANETYNPEDVLQYAGKIFITGSKSEYGVTEDGRLTGRASLEGAEIELIAGLDKEYHPIARDLLEGYLLEGLRELIRERGHEVREGSLLILSTKEDATGNKNGFMSSPIVEIRQGATQ